ncbi:MAG: ATP-dependent helicase [Candidatus Micrarchaeaceae archaeon]
MFTYLDKPFTEDKSLSVLNPYVKGWFKDNFKTLTPPQRFAFKLIHDRTNVLVTAPTGSGKTISGFLSIISRLFDYSIQNRLEDKIYCIYISPLRALNNDIYRNLAKPLAEIYERISKDKAAQSQGAIMKKVTIAVRTGDTSQKERRAQLAKPPNILVTTPESLAIILNSERFMESMKDLEYIIIDEVHELASNKRGVHLSLSVARLEGLIGHKLVKIGMGATLYPLEEAAKFLVGYKDGAPNDCTIVDASWSKKLDAKVISPVKDMIYTKDDKIEDAIYSTINRTIQKSNTTLIFTNTRSGTERVVFNLKKRFNYGEKIAAHHGSLSRDSRLEVEELLKKGSLKCVVSSTSLELGIDIGTIDNVVQLGSPKSITRAVQRIGRAGHSFNSVAKGELLVLNRDDLVECSVMVDSALKKHLDSFNVPKNALDVLAQHIVGMALNRKWKDDEAYELVKTAYPYSNLQRHDFDALLNYLAGNYVGLESRHVYGKIWYDEKEHVFGRRGKLTKVIYMLNSGTIPDEVAVNVYMGKKWIGSIEEEFLLHLKPGDIFTLGGKLYMFSSSRGMSCYVSEAKASAPTIPPWFSEQLPLSYELALEIGRFRAKLAALIKKHITISTKPRFKKLPADIDKFLSAMPINENSKIAIANYFLEQLLFAGEIPNDRFILVEQTTEPSAESNLLIFHALFGRRVNDALSRAMAIELSEMLDEDIGIMVSDNGFVLNLPKGEKVTERNIKDIISEIAHMGMAIMLKQNIRRTELMRRKFRHVAARSFMILRNYKGWKISVGKQQFNSQILLRATEEMDQNFPVLKETYREILEDTMDLPRAEMVISDMNSNAIKIKLVRMPLPSPFSHTMLTFGSADVIMMKERRKYLQKLHTMVMERIER